MGMELLLNELVNPLSPVAAYLGSREELQERISEAPGVPLIHLTVDDMQQWTIKAS